MKRKISALVAGIVLTFGLTTTAAHTASAATPSSSKSDKAAIGISAPKGNPSVIKAAASTTGKMAAPSTLAAAATPNYFYNVGSQAAVTSGVYASLTVAAPALASTDYHTLAELAVQSADGRQIVEVGWNIDKVVNKDTKPHLFVYHWVNKTPSCYNGCGFVNYSGATYLPGATLTPAPNTSAKKFGIQYDNGAWWISYDNTWVGYFPESLWTSQGVTSFKQSGLIQVFGEVAAASTKPCTDMGNGLPGTNTAAAMISSVTYISGPTVSLNVRNAPSTTFYTPSALSTRTFRYGGAGAC